ncbi:MAG: penicillin-binding protein activator [Gammaproteobacteria bacterium]|nr:penicillin-binding protein activator [Gammaproteobacteria bacterium]
MSSPVTRHPATTFIIALLVTACGSQPRPEATITVPVVEETPVAVPGSEGDYTALLDSIHSLLQERQLPPAASILREIQRDKLTLDEQARHSLLWAQLYYLRGDVTSALVSLSLEQLRLSDMSPESRWQVQRETLRMLSASGDTLAVARTANQWLAGSSEPGHRAFLIDRIWHQLQSSSLTQLRKESEKASADSHWRGWLDLSLIAARVAESPDIQVAEIQLWQERYSEHPLAGSLPGGLELLDELANTRPERVALLLPLSNALASAAQAVLDGYLAMQYDSAQRGWEPQQLLVLDTDRYADINTAYLAAVHMGTELVIGPLAKETLAQWAPLQAADSAPLLALNWLEQQPVDSSGLYQMALAPEDEARQIAQLAFDQGARQALLIRPAGTWGDTMSDAFEERWQQLQGELRSTAVYSGRSDYSSSIKAALNLVQSETRARKIRQLMGTEVEFSPRRRQDIDSVFLLSGQPAEARSIKPLIAFHYAEDLPVYSTSHVFSGQPSPQLDRDLNGVRLVQMPWLLQQTKLRQTIKASGATETLAAMYALGADAFLLHWRLGQLRASPNNSIRGHTGLLSMDERGRVHRQLLAATFSGGIPVPLRQ